MPIAIAATNAMLIARGAWSSGTLAIVAALIAQPMRMNSRVRSISSVCIASAAVVSAVGEPSRDVVCGPVGGRAIWINLKGREPGGGVDPADYAALRAEIIAKLEALRDDRGRKVVRLALPRECEERIRRFHDAGITVLMVSHSPEAIRKNCSRCIWLDAGQLRAEGETEKVLAAYAGHGTDLGERGRRPVG